MWSLQHSCRIIDRHSSRIKFCSGKNNRSQLTQDDTRAIECSALQSISRHHFATSILSQEPRLLLTCASSHSALTTVVFKIFEWLPVLSVSHLLSSPSLWWTAVISTSISPSGRRGPPGKPEAEFECVVFSCDNIGRKRLMPASFWLFRLCLVSGRFLELLVLRAYDPLLLREYPSSEGVPRLRSSSEP